MLSVPWLPRSERVLSASASAAPLVLTPEALGFRGEARDVPPWLERHASAFRASVAREGALLLRGFPLDDAWDFERAMKALGYELYQENEGGASPRRKVTKETFVSTEAPAPFIIGFHTEFCYQSTRPSVIAFYCEGAPARYGETPIFDCAAVLDALSDGLRAKLEERGVRYRRFFRGGRSRFNFRKTWREAFGTEEREVVERFLEREGMSCRWDDAGNLETELTLPAVLLDPASGRPCLSLTLFNGDSFVYNFRHFRDRYPLAKRLALEWFVRRESARKDCFLSASFGDGSPFTRAESEEIQRAAWSQAYVFRWRRGDCLILDNLRYGHARLNVEKPRAIVVAMADPYDVRDLDREAPRARFA